MNNGNNGPKDDLDNHANQLNPNNDAYWRSRVEEDCVDDDDSANGEFDDCEGEDYTAGWKNND